MPKETTVDWLSTGMLVLGILQVLATFPFWKYLLKLRDTVLTVGELETSFEKDVKDIKETHELFKEEVITKLQSIEKELTDQKQEFNMQISQVTKEINLTNLEFSKAVGGLNVLMTRLDGTLNSFKVTLEKGEENFKNRIEALSKEITNHKDSTRDLIRELRSIKDGKA